MHCHHMRHRMECKPLYFEIPTQTRSRRTTSGIFRPSFSQSAGGILLSRPRTDRDTGRMMACLSNASALSSPTRPSAVAPRGLVGLDRHFNPEQNRGVSYLPAFDRPDARGSSAHVCCASRRDLATLVSSSAMGLLPLMEERIPEEGDCPTCLRGSGRQSGGLGTCGDSCTCLSTYDDRPAYFYNPWEWSGAKGPQEAMSKITAEVERQGGHLERVEVGGAGDGDNGAAGAEGYIWATFKSGQVTDDVEFLIPPGDTTVSIRAASRTESLPGKGRNKARLKVMRLSLGWDEVPILRNRRRLFFVVESPWDDFGPPPPPSLDYRLDLGEDGAGY